ncbi:hypothetical protein DFJ73DRAFT_762244 [Zopfochytrium polystomum]|nr:hypothetical protein DFJ73DRAFT_762244 [Zopfochytrium polystomum]
MPLLLLLVLTCFISTFTPAHRLAPRCTTPFSVMAPKTDPVPSVVNNITGDAVLPSMHLDKTFIIAWDVGDPQGHLLENPFFDDSGIGLPWTPMNSGARFKRVHTFLKILIVRFIVACVAMPGMPEESCTAETEALLLNVNSGGVPVRRGLRSRRSSSRWGIGSRPAS